MVNNDWKNQQTKTLALHLDMEMVSLANYDWGTNMTEEEVRDDVEKELRAYVDRIVEGDYTLHELMVDLIEDSLFEVDWDELVEYTMDMIETDKLKRKFIYTFWDAESETDIDVEADGFEEASYIMFSDSEYDPKTCEMVRCVEN